MTPLVTAPVIHEPGTSPSILNEAQLASLTKTEEICRKALHEDYLVPLTTLDEGEEETEHHVTEESIISILALCSQARGKSTAAISATGGKILTGSAGRLH